MTPARPGRAPARRAATSLAAVLAAAALAALASAGCERGGAGGAPAAPTRPPPRAWSVVVETTRAERLAYRVDALGELLAEEEVEVAAEVEGVIGALGFREGSRVTTATALVEVDPVRYGLAVERAAASVSRAAAQLQDKEATLARRAALREKQPGYVPEEEMIRLEAEVLAARASLAEARAGLGLARHDLERSVVRAPIEGEVERRLVNAGQFVRVGTPIAAIVRRRPLRLRFSITEEESARIRPGIPVDFEVPAYPGETFRASLFFVARTASPRTRRVECLAQFPNEDERLKPGYFARARIEERAREDAVLVPETAVLATEKGFVVYVVEGGRTARLRRIETGLRTADGRVEVVRGLAPGEALVVRGAGLLQEGVPVAVEAAPATASASPSPAPPAVPESRTP